jgi:valyl-tRNA synthetase
MVNWDPKALTALSDEEVIYHDEHSKLYYMKYYVAEETAEEAAAEAKEGEVIHRDAQGRRYAVVATTRPETIMGDVAMCINPADPKNTWLKGKKVIVPLVGRVIPVIEDSYVDIEFGTGCLKVTPAHDVNDYMLGEKYNLPVIDVFNPDGTLSEAAGMYVGQDRFDVRKQIAIDLTAAGLMEREEDYNNKVGFSERTNVPIEPRLSMQWFLKMEHLAKPALEVVMDDEIKFYPPKYKNTYRHWMENIKDWCISRQLWWGHRIPAYYLPEGGFVVAETAEEALQKAIAKTGNKNLTVADLRQDSDCLDTWFSSWLWPISLFDGIKNPEGEEIKYYYPTADLVTGPDIIFFWVARMIMAGCEYMKDVPFRNVYFTGIVRDKLGRKMSKSLGNSPDPLDLIARYGADGVRMGMMLSAPAGNDILFDDSLCEQGRNFNNKIWNAFRLVQGWQVADNIEQPEAAREACAWFEALLSHTGSELHDLFGKYRLSEALMLVYKLFWDEFSSWYLEWIKPAYGAPIDAVTYQKTLGYFETLLKMLHPFMPFITEELWQHLTDRKEGESIMFETLPQFPAEDSDEYKQHVATIARIEIVKEVITNIRAVRSQKGISPKQAVELQYVGIENPLAGLEALILKSAGVSAINNISEKNGASSSFLVGTTEFAIPLEGNVNVQEELKKLEAERTYLEGFKASVMKKLGNEKFVNGAPAAVVEVERKKLADTESKLKSIEESIAAYKAL